MPKSEYWTGSRYLVKIVTINLQCFFSNLILSVCQSRILDKAFDEKHLFSPSKVNHFSALGHMEVMEWCM